eukprot:g5089.t1
MALQCKRESLLPSALGKLHENCPGVAFDRTHQPGVLPRVVRATLGGWVLWTAKICKVYRLSMDADIFSSLEIDMKLFFVSYPEFCSAETLVLILKKLCQDHTTEVLSFVDVWLSKGFFFDQLSSSTRRTTLSAITNLLSDTCMTKSSSLESITLALFTSIQQSISLYEVGANEPVCSSENVVEAASSGNESLGNDLHILYCTEADGPKLVDTYCPTFKMAKLFDISVDLLAKELTLIDQDMFQSISAFDYLHKSWECARYSCSNDSSRIWIDHFNAGSQYLVSQILAAADSNQRVQRVIFVARLGKALLEIHNFMSSAMVTFALSHASLKTLYVGWNRLPSETEKEIEELMHTFSHEQNYANYRKRIKHFRTVHILYGNLTTETVRDFTPPGPCIPNLLVHHKDIFYDSEISHQNPNAASNHSNGGAFIDLHRTQLVGKTLLFLQGLKKSKFKFRKNCFIRIILEETFHSHMSCCDINKRKYQSQLHLVGKILF